MATINRVTGVKQVCNKLTNIEKIVPNSLQHSLQYGAVFLRDRAIDNLKGMTNTAGASKDGESITNIDKWEWVPEGQTSGWLICNSKHAAVVELGGEETGTTLVSMTIGPGYPIGKQQFGDAIPDCVTGKPTIRKSFLIQQPKPFFRSAIESAWVRESMTNRIKRDVWRTIKNQL